ncbi:MAG: hypothetical protein NC086_04450 [Alistipes sp.]|nr:hypothetical protein [Alistipes sp.]
MIRGNNQGKVQYAYLLLIAAFTGFLGMAALENKTVLLIKNRIDNVLTVAGFSGTLCDLRDMGENMSVIRYEEDGRIYYDFEAMYDNASVYIDEEGLEERVRMVLEENMARGGLMRGIIKKYSLDRVIVYNEYTKEPVSAPNGVTLDGPGIYLRIRLDIRGIFARTRTVYLDKCIAVKTK